MQCKKRTNLFLLYVSVLGNASVIVDVVALVSSGGDSGILLLVGVTIT